MGTKASTADEWMELYNCSGGRVDLSGWVLRSRTGAEPDPLITLKGSIESGEYFLLERTDDNSVSVQADQIYTGALSNAPAGEILELSDNGGQIIDSVDGTSSWHNAGDNTSKSTMERMGCGPDSEGNWATNNNIIINGQDASRNLIFGTPRAKNSVNP